MTRINRKFLKDERFAAPWIIGFLALVLGLGAIGYFIDGQPEPARYADSAF